MRPAAFRGLQVPQDAEHGGRGDHGTVVRRRVGPGSECAPTRFAVAGACTAAGYAAIGVVAGLWLGTQKTTAPVGGLVYGLAVGMPTAVAASHY
ncbi:hypothetical protein BRC75_00585 [Halobacteriales archaeon QH_7_69_31]|nr:MAG: hypothetical protein BRC75_00585 [Halobacteriales archaeon QH_7_69_31]